MIPKIVFDAINSGDSGTEFERAVIMAKFTVLDKKAQALIETFVENLYLGKVTENNAILEWTKSTGERLHDEGANN